VCALHAAYALYLLVALVGFHARRRRRWLPARPSRATLASLWKCAGSMLLAYGAVTCLALGAAELREPVSSMLFRNGLDPSSARARAAARFLLGGQCVLLGCLSFWSKLRITVHAKLASLGEGVAAAAGIAELLGYFPIKKLIGQAERTLRSVRLDLVRQSHFDPLSSAHAAFAASMPARLGSIDVRCAAARCGAARLAVLLRSCRSLFSPCPPDRLCVDLDLGLGLGPCPGARLCVCGCLYVCSRVAPSPLCLRPQAFVSHSWRDDPTEKWRALQAWRESFVRENGREPTIWIDRCCLDPDQLSAVLPCLPVFAAACDKMLVLRGSTYLNRLVRRDAQRDAKPARRNARDPTRTQPSTAQSSAERTRVLHVLSR
jgi:hypothetical protein